MANFKRNVKRLLFYQKLAFANICAKQKFCLRKFAFSGLSDLVLVKSQSKRVVLIKPQYRSLLFMAFYLSKKGFNSLA
jgi:hypothetical protein